MELSRACTILEENIGLWLYGETPHFKVVVFYRPHWKWGVRLRRGNDSTLMHCNMDGEIKHYHPKFCPDISDILARDYEVKHV